jgi:hypothetical protein
MTDAQGALHLLDGGAQDTVDVACGTDFTGDLGHKLFAPGKSLSFV